MNEIKCPHCGEMFTVDENAYASILQQVRNDEFEKELARRIHETEEKMKVSSELAVNNATMKATQASEDEIKKLNALISDLTAKLNASTSTHEAEMQAAKSEYELNQSKALSELEKKHLDEVHDLQEELNYYKDLKARASTKMIGESLEQHCMDEFDKIRATAFPNDYFEKDNEISETGSKGDFIYRAYDSDGNELVSIMFEMKNEASTTEKKHKNSDFFKELDKDRKEKNCEYAVLCSLLEADSDLYNQGIVDVSHRYEKMFVIRPQFFITIISLLRNAAKSQESLKKELVLAKKSNVDLVEFENQVELFKTAFGKNCDLVGKKFQETIDELDKSITHLQKTRDALVSCDRNLKLANDKSDALTVKKLLKNSPSLLEEYKTTK